MRKSFFTLGVILLTVFLMPKTSFALSIGFGGRVEATKISGVTCSGDGVLVVLSSNVNGAVGAISSAVSKGSSTVQKVSGVVNGIYKMIPYYATDSSKKPQVGGHIIGKADLGIDTSTCSLESGETSVPFPVRRTSVYQISPNPKARGSNSVDSNIPSLSNPDKYPSA